MTINDNTWCHFDEDGGLYAVHRDEDHVVVNGRRFTPAQARELALSLLQFAPEGVDP